MIEVKIRRLPSREWQATCTDPHCSLMGRGWTMPTFPGALQAAKFIINHHHQARRYETQ